MSDLPKGWAKCQLRDICTFIGGSQPPKKEFVFEPREGYIRLIQIRDYKSNNHLTFIPIKSARRFCSKEEVMIGRYGPPLFQILRGIEGAYNVALMKAAAKSYETLDNNFLYYLLQNSPLKNYIIGVSERTVGQDGVRKDLLEEYTISLPPLREQKRIVEKLEKLLGRVEAAQARLDKIPAILKRFRQSVLAAACSGKLTADWRGTDSNGELPFEWKDSILGEHAELITKGASPKWQGINYASSGVLFVTSENVGTAKLLLDSPKYVEEAFNEKQKRSILKSGDLLTNIVGASIGRTAIYDREDLANINQAVALIRLKKDVSREYVLLVLNSPHLVQHMNEEKVDVARANLSLKDVADFPVPLPPSDEQREIVRRVEELLKFADAVEERYKKAKAYTDKLTQSILAKAFRGELVPQDPNDEPADKLLQRLTAKNTLKKAKAK